ncbi:MAG: translation initiation factor IF-2 [Candidatus Nanoarchaeia archaeon]
MTKIRSPICIMMGHVDHGKTTILDSIRGTAVAKGEAGGITQAISSTNLTIETIKKICGELLNNLKIKITIPGLLFIDSPGHAAFTNLRKRGGNLADIAVLVIDINEGVKPQTLECIDILKQYKTPFIVAANKIDLIPGWDVKKGFLIKSITSQAKEVQEKLDIKLYELVGKLHELGFSSERFDRVEDYTKQIAIVPVSGKMGEGLAELIMVITGLAQRYLEKGLKYDLSGPGKGTILEVKETKGIGQTLDVIIYDGTIKKNDQIVIGGLDKPIVTKVKALFQPDKDNKKVKTVQEVHAAIGVKISAPDLKDTLPGMPLRVANKDLEKIKQEVQEEVEEVMLDVDNEGVVVKADSLGSLEALINLLKDNGIKIKRASIGDISKKDVVEGSAELEPVNKVIVGFNVKTIEQSKEVKIITADVIYRIIDEIKKWQEEEKRKLEEKELAGMTRPFKAQILMNCIFRQSNPAVVGVEVLGGTLRVGSPMIKANGNKASEIKSMQKEGENIQEAKKGEQVAIAIPHLTVGRQINELDILYSDITEEEFVKYKRLKRFLNNDEIAILKEIAEIKRQENPVWGV